jgi:hypothetical protein
MVPLAWNSKRALGQRYLRRAHRITEAYTGLGHERIASLLFFEATLLEDSDASAATDLSRRALAIYRDKLGDSATDTEWCVILLDRLLESIGVDVASAERTFTREWANRVLAREHPHS